MRRSVILACWLSFGLLTACHPPANVPVSPDPDPSPASGSNPFPRLTNPQPGQPLEVAEYFADPGNGVKVSEVRITGGTDTDEDGVRDYQVQAKVDLGSKGIHDVEIVESDAPAGSGKPDVFTVKDLTDDSRFVFELSSDGKQARIRQGEAMLKVAIAGEETVSLDDGTPMAIEPAAQQALDSMFQGKVSPHGLALLYAKLIRTPIDGAQAYRLENVRTASYRTQSGATLGMLNRYLFERYLYVLLLMLNAGTMPISMQVELPGALARG